MKLLKYRLWGSCCLFALAWLYALATHAAEDATSAPEVATESTGQHDTRMSWWREARFGMFIHWGLYSAAAGAWDGKPTSGAGEWLMNDLQIPDSKYAKLVPLFDPEKFDATEWVRIAKGAGMKYIVLTTKHHDGFALYPSALTGWCIKATPFKRDPLKELAAACREQGVKLGFYHSIMDWHHPDYLPRKPWNDLASSSPDFSRYVGFLKGELKELLTGYGPISVLWFDGQWENTWTYERGADLYNYVRALQPDMIINNRVGTEQPLLAGQHAVGDYKTPEQTIPPTGLGTDWETCMTMNNTWGFKANDHDWKSVEVLVRNLVDCASKGGNYLLNVGPTAEGLIPDASIERLQQIGHWMQLNGEAIYGTAASPFAKPLAWGRCTQKSSGKDTLLYLHVFNWPADGELLVPGLKNRVESAQLLPIPAQAQSLLPVETADDGLVLTLPKNAPDPISSTILVRIAGPPDVQPVALQQRRNGSVLLPANEANLHGHTFKYESGGALDNIGYWTTPEDWAEWEFQVKRPGKFAVSAVIAAPASGAFELSLAGQTLRCAAPNTGSYTAFKSVPLGIMEVRNIGKAILAVRPIENGWQPMNLKSIQLTPLATTTRSL
ncbi:MAG TPA: alpha-L-fucosidase [Candidatus Dormibacteraeota bacterium]|nr:alpha-L-fucosidase [Candidatus Dormibacteraeota bacterium]